MHESQEYNVCLQQIQDIKDDGTNFESVALNVFKYQYTYNPLLKQYAQLVSKTPDKIQALEDIPFLPIEFFKSHRIQTGHWEEEDLFSSSGTTGMITSKHYVRDMNAYLQGSRIYFEQCYGDLENIVLLALLPSYLERKNSSLVKMVEHLIDGTRSPFSGFYMYDFKKLAETLRNLMLANSKVVLIGVSFALLDFAEAYPMSLKNTDVIETGGMKGRREEMTRQELHSYLRDKFNLQKIDSEYGMTELFSQAYMTNGMRFEAAKTMQVYTTDLNDPLKTVKNKSGRLAVIDLANLNTCAFIQTNDLAICHSPKSFEVIGRVDDSDLRGCNLLYM